MGVQLVRSGVIKSRTLDTVCFTAEAQRMFPRKQEPADLLRRDSAEVSAPSLRPQRLCGELLLRDSPLSITPRAVSFRIHSGETEMYMYIRGFLRSRHCSLP